MKKTSTLTPLFFACLAAVLQFTLIPEARAFGGAPGGPFSNGSYFPDDGTFSAVVRGENLSGTVQFSTSSGSVAAAGSGVAGADAAAFGGSTGVSSIYYDGDTYRGNSQGSINSQSSTMTVNFQADIAGQGQNTIVVNALVQNTSTTNGTTTTTTDTVPYKEILFFDCLYLNGYADCKTSNAFPNQKFSGTGEAQFQQLNFFGSTPVLESVTIPISVSGVRLSNTSSTFATKEIQPPSVSQFSLLAQ